MADDVIRVLLVDDHLVVRAGLRALLGAAPDVAVVGEAPNGREAVTLAERLRPDVIVMDLSMPQMDGIASTRELAAHGVAARVLVLTMHTEEEFLLAALDAGASGYLVKSAVEHELVDAIRALSYGDMYVQPRAARVLTGRAANRTPGEDQRRRLARLTDREREVLRLIAEGHSAPDVGHMLEISTKTVDTYKQRIGEKLGLVGRPEYVRFALESGLLVPHAAPAAH